MTGTGEQAQCLLSNCRYGLIWNYVLDDERLGQNGLVVLPLLRQSVLNQII